MCYMPTQENNVFLDRMKIMRGSLWLWLLNVTQRWIVCLTFLLLKNMNGHTDQVGHRLTDKFRDIR
jgi:hypothetical protein